MSKKNKILVFFAFLCVFLFPTYVDASTNGLSVQPVTPDTQRKASESYFDVVVAPGKSTTLKIVLTNSTSHDIQVKTKVRVAETSDNGTVSYLGHQKRDKTLKHDISKYVESPKKLTIPAKGTTTYVATLKMPKKQLSGMIAGGIIISPINYSVKKSSGNLSIVNNYNYDIALIARNVNKTWVPKLKVQKAQVRQDDHQNTIAVPMHNVSSTYLNQLSVTAKAKNLRTGKTYKRTASEMQMAPNSHFYYRLKFPKKIPVGKYRILTHAYYVKDANGKYKNSKGTHFKYEVKKTSTVNVTKQKSHNMQKQISQDKGGTPWFVYAVLGLIAVLVLAVITLTVMLIRKRKHSN